MFTLPCTYFSSRQNSVIFTSWYADWYLTVLPYFCFWQKGLLLLCSSLLECSPSISSCHPLLRNFQSSPQTSSLHQLFLLPACCQPLHLILFYSWTQFFLFSFTLWCAKVRLVSSYWLEPLCALQVLSLSWHWKLRAGDPLVYRLRFTDRLAR